MSEGFVAGFDQFTADGADGVRLRVRVGGQGPVELLHGHPRTHTTWHRVVPLLAAAGYTVVRPDLRGYGQSSKPPTTEDHAPCSTRAMPATSSRSCGGLGHERFTVGGHDRGSCVARAICVAAGGSTAATRWRRRRRRTSP